MIQKTFGSKLSNQRPASSTTSIGGVGQEEIVHLFAADNGETLRMTTLKNSNLGSEMPDTLKKKSPSLFKNRPKYIAKQFNPFEERTAKDKTNDNSFEQGELLNRFPKEPLKFKRIEARLDCIDEQKTVTHKIGIGQQDGHRIRPMTAASSSKSGISNIFDNLKVYEQYSKNDFGAKYDEEGNMKQYSIVGKVEWYQKAEIQANKKALPKVDNQFSLDKFHHHNERSSHKPKLSSLESMDKVKERRLSKVVSHESLIGGVSSRLLSGKSVKSLAGRNGDEEETLLQELNEQEVETCIEQVRRRVEEANERIQNENKAELSKIRKGDCLYLTKEQRILENFEKEQKQQVLDIKRNCQLSNKNFADSCQLRVGEARTKQELKDLLDIVQPDAEKYGANTFWQVGLRRDREERELRIEEIQKRCKKVEGIEMQAKQRNQMDSIKVIRMVEQVRKPMSSKLRTDKQNKLPFHAFGSHSYLQQKLQERQKYVSQFADVNNQEIEAIEIVGQNVLKAEINSLHSNKHANQHFLLKIKNTCSNVDLKAPILRNSPRATNMLSQRNISPRSANSQPTQESHHQQPLQLFLSQKPQNQLQEEQIIESNYNTNHMSKGAYIFQQVKLKY